MAADFTTQMKLENDLWSFALHFYQQPGVETLCLKLQNSYGLSINRLLLACWAGYQGRVLDTAQFSEADKWQSQITQPLRQLRYRVRERKTESGFETCYQALRKAELACEQVELALLFEMAQVAEMAPGGALLVEKNLQLYLKSLKQPIDREIESDLGELQQALATYLGTNVSQ